MNKHTDALHNLRFPPVYLAERFEPTTKLLLEAEVFCRLDLALEWLYHELLDYEEQQLRVEVSWDGADMEGLAILNEVGDILGIVAVYYLDRERMASATTPGLEAALAMAPDSLSLRLTEIFRR